MTTVGLLFESAAGLRRLFQRRLETERSLSSQSFDVLIRLARTPGSELRMSELAAQASLTPSGLTRSVDRLQDQGLVERRVCPEDRRGRLRRADSGRSGADGPRRAGTPGPRQRGAQRRLHRRRGGHPRRRYCASSATTSWTPTQPVASPPTRATSAPTPTRHRSAHRRSAGPWPAHRMRRRAGQPGEQDSAAARTRVSSRFPSTGRLAGRPIVGSIHSQRVRRGDAPPPRGPRCSGGRAVRPSRPTPNGCQGGSGPPRQPAGRPRTHVPAR